MKAISKSRILSVMIAVVVLFGFGFMFCACDDQSQPTSTSHKITFLSSEAEGASVLGVINTNGNEELTLPEIPYKQGYEPNDSRFYYYEIVQAKDEQGNVIPGVENRIEYTFTKDTLKTKALNNDLTVYAMYIPLPFSIHYIVEGVDISQNVNINDARTLNDEQTANLNCVYYYVSDKELALPQATVAGKEFVGWYLTATFDQKFTAIPAGSTGDLVLYAQFR